MIDAYRKLREALPSRSQAPAGGFPTEPKRVKAWVEALPRANPAQTQRLLAEALQSLAEVRLDGGQRLAILETLRPALLENCAALGRLVQGASLPLPPAKARAMQQLVGFEAGLAHGYRLATVEHCGSSGNIPFLRGSAVAQSCQRALYHRSRHMQLAYALYQAPEAGSWQLMHALYLFARSQKLDDKAVDEPAEGGSVSVRQLYVQAVLLALSNPFRFSQREQAELWTVSRDLALQLSLHDDRPVGDDVFAIPLDGDDGPGYIPEERAAEAGNTLWLDLSGLRRLLERPLADTLSGPVRLRVGGSSIDSTAELLRRLRGGWGSAAARSHQRLSAGHVLGTVFGLAGVHFHLAGGVDLDSFLRRSGVLLKAAERDRHDWAHAGVDAGRVPVFSAEVLDQSLGGYRVRWSAEQQVKARVGELVGISIGDDSGARQWMLGVIRWLRYAADGSVDAGIELLARRIRPVAIRSLDDDTRPRLCAIEYRALRGDDQATLHLAVPSVFESLGGNIEVIRAPDAAELEPEQLGQQRCEDVRVLENAGDHLVVRARRAEATA